MPAAALKQAVEVTIPQALRFINAGVNKMEALLAGLLRFSRLGREALIIEPLDMNALIAEMLAAMKYQLDAAEAEVQVGALPVCHGDRVQTSQVFANLIDNALKYRIRTGRPASTSTGGPRRPGRFTRWPTTGSASRPEHQAKAFEIFHRLNPDGSAGEGLGLTIAQRVLERQKGRIWVESAGAGAGSTFFVSLPAEAPQAGPGP